MKKIPQPVDEYYYYIRDGYNHPRITVCLLKFGENVFCRGIAICSFSEKQLLKSRGRNKAKGRAIKSFIEKDTLFPIERFEADRILTICDCVGSLGFVYKGMYDVSLNHIERKILGNVNS